MSSVYALMGEEEVVDHYFKFSWLFVWVILSGMAGAISAVGVPLLGPVVAAMLMALFYGAKNWFIVATVSYLFFTVAAMIVTNDMYGFGIQGLSVCILLVSFVFWGTYLVSWYAFSSTSSTGPSPAGGTAS